jgi:hypothetical protein
MDSFVLILVTIVLKSMIDLCISFAGFKVENNEETASCFYIPESKPEKGSR